MTVVVEKEKIKILFKDSEEQQENLEKLDTLIQKKIASFNPAIQSFFAENADMEKRQILLSEKRHNGQHKKANQ